MLLLRIFLLENSIIEYNRIWVRGLKYPFWILKVMNYVKIQPIR